MHTLLTRRRPSSQDDSSHIRTFTRIMLQGDLRRAIRLVMDQGKSRCLLPEDIAHRIPTPKTPPKLFAMFLRGILAKMMVMVTCDHVTQECGIDQLCCGLANGVEVAAHSMNSLFASDATDNYVVFLNDASNAFNNLNRIRMLVEVRKRWPRGAIFVFNCYQQAVTLVLQGAPPSSWFQSIEGVTQGDPLSMLLYGLTLLPLIRLLSDRLRKKIRQCWFADDGAAYAHIDDALEWHQILSTEAPAIGMYTNPTECIIIAHPSAVARLTERLSGTPISISTGYRYLGSFIGEHSGQEAFVHSLSAELAKAISTLGNFARDSPQAAYTVFVRAFQQRYFYAQRVIATDDPKLMQDLETSIRSDFLTALLDSSEPEISFPPP